MYTEGQIITKEEHVEFANWTNANGGKFYSEPNGDGVYTVRKVVVVEPTTEEKTQLRIEELKSLLISKDYWTSKRADGEYSEEEWAKKVAIRRAWRAEINELEKTLTKTKESAIVE